jgi:hypothetical protein
MAGCPLPDHRTSPTVAETGDYSGYQLIEVQAGFKIYKGRTTHYM